MADLGELTVAEFGFFHEEAQRTVCEF